MKKKNKEKEFEDIQEDLEDNYEDDNDEIIDEDDSEIIDSSLEIGGQIHQQSDIIKKSSPHLPKDTKYSKFNNIDVANYVLKSKTYQLWRYIKKIQAISKPELQMLKDKKKEIYSIKSLNDLKTHLESIGKGYVWYSLIQLSTEDLNMYFDKMLKQLELAKQNGVINIVYRDKTMFYDAYNQYCTNEVQHKDIDDFGLMNSMLTLTEVKKAHAGWAMNSMNTTINVTREENHRDDVEEEPEQSERGFSKLMKK